MLNLQNGCITFRIMNTTFVLTPEIKAISRRAKDTFKHLELTNARIIQGQTNPESIPYIEFILLGDGIKFTACANLIPGSNVFNGFDLLEAAKQALAQDVQVFERVEIRAFDEHYKNDYRIEGAVYVEYDVDKSC